MNKLNSSCVLDGAGSGSEVDGNSSFLNCFYTNSTSLNNKISELASRLSIERFPHLVFVAETLFVPESAPCLVGYDLHRFNRPTRGCGVAIYVREDLVTVEAAEEVLFDYEVEQVWYSVRVGSDRILVGCLYRPPETSCKRNLFTKRLLDPS